MRWAGHVAHMGEGRGVHRVLVGKPEGKRPLGRPRRRWEDNIKISGVPRGVGVFKPPPPPKFRSFDKAEPNSQFRGKYIRNNLTRIRLSLIF